MTLKVLNLIKEGIKIALLLNEERGFEKKNVSLERRLGQRDFGRGRSIDWA